MAIFRASESYMPVDDDEHKGSPDDAPSMFEQYRDMQRHLRLAKRGLVVLTSICVLVSVLSLAMLYRKSTSSSGQSHPSDKVLTPVPHMPLGTVVFNRDDRYASPSTPESDRAWHEMMPVGDGFIIVNNSQQYNFQPGKQTSDGELYDVSMFHQLHCLTMIREYLYTILFSIHRNNTKEVHDILLAPQDHHIHHCFDYLRQGIMCAGDMTIEWPREEPDGRRFAVNGWGVPHQCKSWDSIMEFMNTHHSSDALGQVG